MKLTAKEMSDILNAIHIVLDDYGDEPEDTEAKEYVKRLTRLYKRFKAALKNT